MQIGFNNEIDFEEHRYHIQTEDHGLDDGRITSQIFRGGQIVDTMTVSYNKAIERFTEPEERDEEIRKRMKALHALCFRNIRSGKYSENAEAQPETEAEQAEQAEQAEPTGKAPPSQVMKAVAVSPDAEQADTAAHEPILSDDEEEEHQTTLEMDSPDLELPAEIDNQPDLAALADEMNVSLEIEEISLDQLSDSGLIPVEDEPPMLDIGQTHVDAGPVAIDLSGRFMASTTGIVYDRAVRAFRGIDLPLDETLLTLLREIVHASRL